MWGTVIYKKLLIIQSLLLFSPVTKDSDGRNYSKTACRKKLTLQGPTFDTKTACFSELRVDVSFLAFRLIESEPLVHLRAISRFVSRFSYSDSVAERLAGHFLADSPSYQCDNDHTLDGFVRGHERNP